MAGTLEQMRAFAMQANPHSWFMVASELHEQAVFLYKRSSGLLTRNNFVDCTSDTWRSCNRSIFLLAGFAIENILKSYLVYEKPDWIEKGRLKKILQTHSLTKLESLSSLVPYKSRRSRVLRSFETGLNSWARYPCGLSITEWRDPDVVTRSLWRSYRGLMRQYGRKLQTVLSRPWNGPHEIGPIQYTFDRQFFRIDGTG